MIDVAQQRRWIYSGLLCSSLLVLTAHSIVDLFNFAHRIAAMPPTKAAMPVVVATPVVQPLKLARVHAHPMKVALQSVAPRPPAAIVTADLTGVDMSTNMRDYRIHFSGKLMCDGTPCAGNMRVVLDSENNPNRELDVEAAPNGQFSADLSIREMASGPLDWSITGQRGLTMSKELAGRVILLEDPDIKLERSLSIQS